MQGFPKSTAQRPDWIAVDWGTSNFRAWGFDRNDQLLCETRSDSGMSKLKPQEFESALLSTIDNWLPEHGSIPVYACGMVGAKQGWVEAPYTQVPCHPNTSFVEAPTADKRMRVFILSGLCQSDPNDVMRGEETQISGLLTHYPGWSGTICLPGTHSKWARLQNGQVTAFQTFMTGELYASCKTATVLSHSIMSEGLDIDVFEKAVTEVLQKPPQGPAKLFSIRANDLLIQTGPVEASSRLSGILIGMELAAIQAKWTFESVTLIGEPTLSRRYGRAFSLAGIESRVEDANALTMKGLTAARGSHVTARP